MKLIHALLRPVVVILATLGLLLGATGGTAYATSGDAADVALERTYPGWSDYDYVRSDVYVETTNPSIGYFYINDFQFNNNTGPGGYIGLQTKMQDCNGGWTVPGIVFSIWNFNGTVSGGSGRYGDAICHNVEEGQPYWSLHYPYDWVPGHWYSFVLHRFFDVYRYNVSAVIYDLTAGTPATYIGAFAGLPSTWSWFNPNTGSSTHRSEEFYPGAYADCNTIPRSVAHWGGTWMHSIGNGWIASNPAIIQWIYNKSGLTCTNSSTSGSGTVRQQIGN